MSTNFAPYATLDLDQSQAEWLFEKIEGLRLDFKKEFESFANMSSDDPLSNARSSMIMRLGSELDMFASIAEYMEIQQPSLSDITTKLGKFVIEREVTDD